ncbi:MAG: glycosyltransferase family 4 protein [Ferruginibacter sp.]|nr:glycosyltransferase family 4 protein [Ferruginibacter sp.]
MASSKKKILWLTHEANLSGANIAMLEYANALKDEYDFHFIQPHQGNMVEVIQKQNFGSAIIYQYAWAVSADLPIVKNKIKVFVRSLIAICKTCILIFKEKPSTVFTNTQVPFIASIAAYIMCKPHVWWLHEFGEEDFGFTIGFGKKQKAYAWMQKSKLFIANSKAILNKFQALMPVANIKCIYQPVTVKHFEVIEKKTAPYLMFGQLIKNKGHLEVLSALAKVDNRFNKELLHIIGPSEDAKYVETLQNFIFENGLTSNVKIKTGFFIKEEILPQYNFLIVASKAEAFGRVIIEANKMGLKVIVNNSGGAPELVNETNGILYNTEMDLIKIFNGNCTFNNSENKLAYDENEEIIKLKKYLLEINA